MNRTVDDLASGQMGFDGTHINMAFKKALNIKATKYSNLNAIGSTFAIVDPYVAESFKFKTEISNFSDVVDWNPNIQQYILMPVNNTKPNTADEAINTALPPDHWALIFIDHKTRCIYTLDPFNHTTDGAAGTSFYGINFEAITSSISPEGGNYNQLKVECPMDRDSANSGVHLFIYILQILQTIERIQKTTEQPTTLKEALKKSISRWSM